MGLSVEIVRFGQLSAHDRALWTQWQAANSALASPFFRLEFAQIAAEICPDAYVARVLHDAEPIGFYPYQQRGGALYPLGAPMNDYHGIIGVSEDLPSLSALAELINPKRMMANSWVGDADGAKALRTLQVVLPDGGYEAWYEQRRQVHGKYIKDKARAKRSMEAQMGAMDVRCGVKSQFLLDELIALKRGQYRRTGRHDIFGVEWTRNLLSALLKSSSPDFGASIATLSAGGQTLAIEYSLYSRGHYHFWFPAYLEQGAKFSPGILLSMETMRVEGARGFTVFDYGFEGEPYKKYLTNQSQTIAEAAILRRGKLSALARLGSYGLSLAGADRHHKIRTSIRHRWAAIEATEVTRTGRIKGMVFASQRAVARLGAEKS